MWGKTVVGILGNFGLFQNSGSAGSTRFGFFFEFSRLNQEICFSKFGLRII